MPRLFLANMQIRRSEYMGKDYVSHTMRLVWATSGEEAEAKARQAVEKPDPYGSAISVDYVEITEAIT